MDLYTAADLSYFFLKFIDAVAGEGADTDFVRLAGIFVFFRAMDAAIGGSAGAGPARLVCTLLKI